MHTHSTYFNKVNVRYDKQWTCIIQERFAIQQSKRTNVQHKQKDNNEGMEKTPQLLLMMDRLYKLASYNVPTLAKRGKIQPQQQK